MEASKTEKTTQNEQTPQNEKTTQNEKTELQKDEPQTAQKTETQKTETQKTKKKTQYTPKTQFPQVIISWENTKVLLQFNVIINMIVGSNYCATVIVNKIMEFYQKKSSCKELNYNQNKIVEILIKVLNATKHGVEDGTKFYSLTDHQMEVVCTKITELSDDILCAIPTVEILTATDRLKGLPEKDKPYQIETVNWFIVDIMYALLKSMDFTFQDYLDEINCPRDVKSGIIEIDNMRTQTLTGTTIFSLSETEKVYTTYLKYITYLYKEVFPLMKCTHNIERFEQYESFHLSIKLSKKVLLAYDIAIHALGKNTQIDQDVKNKTILMLADEQVQIKKMVDSALNNAF